MKKVVFFQPYIANWRYQFLRRFIRETAGKYEVHSLHGYVNKKKHKAGNYSDIVGINNKCLFSVPLELKYKGQSYPIYFSPFLFFELVKISPDVIITEGEINIINNISIFLYCKLFKRAYLWWSLGKVRNRSKNAINKLFDPINNILLRNSKAIMARNSLAIKYYMSEKALADKDIILVPNSMDEELIWNDIREYEEESKQLRKELNVNKTILFSGALIKSKKVDDLINAFSIARSRVEGLKLIIVGDGPEKEPLVQLADKLHLDKDVIFTGAVYKDVSKYFMLSDLVVLPGMGGLVIYHALAHGRPVITRMADGTEEDLVINDYNGYILDNYDNEDLANKIVRILTDENLQKQMCINSMSIVEQKWNMKIMIKNAQKAIDM